MTTIQIVVIILAVVAGTLAGYGGGPSVLGESQLRLPVGGKIRAGILVISNRFDSQEGLESLPDTATEQPAKPAKKPPCR